MKAESTKYGQPVITPEIMDHVGRSAKTTCEVVSMDKTRQDIDIDIDLYEIRHIPVSLVDIEDWFRSNVHRSTEIDDPSEFADEGYYILYKAVKEEQLDIVMNVANGSMSLHSHYVLNLEHFLQTYIESLVEQAELPEESIVLDRGALFDYINNEKEQGDIVDIPVCIRKELAYTVGKTPLDLFLCRQSGILTYDTAPTFKWLWNAFYESYLYCDEHVDDWPFVECNEKYFCIE